MKAQELAPSELIARIGLTKIWETCALMEISVLEAAGAFEPSQENSSSSHVSPKKKLRR